MGSAIRELELRISKNGAELERVAISSDGTYSIGRSETCDISIDDPRLSRTHLIMTLALGQLSLRDVSSNGSSIDGESMSQEVAYPVRGDTEVSLASGAVVLYIGVRATEPASAPSQHSRATDPAADLLRRLRERRELTIGRSTGCDVVLESLQVSRRHAVLRVEGADITLEDLDTTNGTFVNGQRIHGRVVVRTSDRISIGATLFALEQGLVDLQYAIVANNIEKTFPGGSIGLNRMSIQIASREFVALMGPSGCGKSTLLKCLNGANPATGGEITIQGLRLNSDNFNTLKKHIGYVPQDDIVHGELTVEKTLFFAAKLRMAADVSNEEINARIDQVLCSLNLDAQQIRRNRIRELSGGQRKRISIAVELLNDPTILFLDEPTSPLDPETIEDFLGCIRDLVRKGQTVIMVTHKPSDLSYVDKVIFLAKGGYQTYYGHKDEVLGYFGKRDIIEVYSLMKSPEAGQRWNQRWLERNPVSRDHAQGEFLEPRPATSLAAQYFWLTARYLNIKWSDSWNLLLLIGQPFIIAFLLIFIFQHLELSVFFMMAISAVWFGVSNASKEIVSELAIYERERMFNLSIGTYVLSKISVLALIALAQVLIFVGIIALAYDQRSSDVQLWNLGATIGFMFYLSVSATIFGLFLSALFDNAEKVMTVVPIALMPQIMLAGVIAQVDSDLKVVLSYFTLGRWGTEGFAHLQDEAARAAGHWADANETIPASVMHYVPGPPAADGAIAMQLQPTDAMRQLGFYDADQPLLSLFPENFGGAVTAIALLNAMFLAGIFIALKRRDSRFI